MEDNKYLNDIDKKIILGDQWHLFDDPLGRSFRTLHKHGILDPWTTEQINQRVEKAGRKRAFDNRVFREPQLNDGELLLGMDINTHKPLRTFIQYLNSGGLLLGGTGCGKTSLIFWLVTQISWCILAIVVSRLWWPMSPGRARRNHHGDRKSRNL